MDQDIQEQRLTKLEQAVNKQSEMLTELVELARKSEERQALAERMAQAISSVQRSLGEQLSNGGLLSEAMKNWRSARRYPGFEAVAITRTEWLNPKPQHVGERVLWSDGIARDHPENDSEELTVLRLLGNP